MHRRLRVLHAVANLNYGGMERLIADMVRLADHERFELHVMGLVYLGRFSTGLDAVATLHVGPRMGRSSFIYPRALGEALRAIQPDIVHTHSGVLLKAAHAARMAGVPRVIHTEHGRRSPDPLSDRVIDHFGSRYVDCMVAVSGVLAEHLAKRLWIPRDKLAVIVNGVETERNRPRPATGALHRELGLAADVPIIGSVGRLEAIKGYDVAIRAMQQLTGTDVENAVLVVAGDGSERQRLQELAGQLGVARRVFLLGWRDDTELVLTESALFTMSSRSEGTSVSLLEAMSSGLCPVVTDVGGNAAVLGPALRHRLVVPESPDALAAAWRAALLDRAARQTDATRARARVLSTFSVEQMVRSYEKLYVADARRS